MKSDSENSLILWLYSLKLQAFSSVAAGKHLVQGQVEKPLIGPEQATESRKGGTFEKPKFQILVVGNVKLYVTNSDNKQL